MTLASNHALHDISSNSTANLMALLRRCIRAWLVLGTSYTFKMYSWEAPTRSSAEETKRVTQQTQRQPCGHINEATYGGRSVLRKVPPSPTGWRPAWALTSSWRGRARQPDRALAYTSVNLTETTVRAQCCSLPHHPRTSNPLWWRVVASVWP